MADPIIQADVLGDVRARLSDIDRRLRQVETPSTQAFVFSPSTTSTYVVTSTAGVSVPLTWVGFDSGYDMEARFIVPPSGVVVVNVSGSLYSDVVYGPSTTTTLVGVTILAQDGSVVVSPSASAALSCVVASGNSSTSYTTSVAISSGFSIPYTLPAGGTYRARTVRGYSHTLATASTGRHEWRAGTMVSVQGAGR